eukprot:TRINITY_DN5687_c3_g1_i6.p2 TRINITY_DN5687_c3_g1~~TRINITY_DN5687_c3_g1_i6.p2  ORF type:complete len:115 (-),score=8.54 TRINITY_DN5687_c3_g1_i6:120-464(-)
MHAFRTGDEKFGQVTGSTKNATLQPQKGGRTCLLSDSLSWSILSTVRIGQLLQIYFNLVSVSMVLSDYLVDVPNSGLVKIIENGVVVKNTPKFLWALTMVQGCYRKIFMTSTAC